MQSQLKPIDIQGYNQLVDKLVYYSPTGHQPLMDKFNVDEIATILDRNKIESIDKIYRSKTDGFNLLEFVRFFLNVIEHEEIETLYLAIALIDFFKEISQAAGYRDRLYFMDITNYICNRILDKRSHQHQIEAKYIPDYRTIVPNFKPKDYLIDPPCIYASKDQLVYKLSLNKIQIDKVKHEGVITNCYFSSTLMRVFTLDDLSDSISVYNTSCRLVNKIKPHFSNLKKDIVVLAFAYSERQERIGAVLKDFSINFWDYCDNFQFQKQISTATHCQDYQTNIWFFEYFNAWVTSDKTGHLYVWNLETEKPQRIIKLACQTQINDLAVIPCINLIAIVQERRIYMDHIGGKKRRDSELEKKDMDAPVIYLFDFTKGEIVTQIQLGTQNRNPHTLQYSENYQVLLSAGYQKKISIFQINKKFLDTNKKGQLTGHQSLITTFMLVKKSPMVVSADDKGKVKIWDIRNFKCVQTLDFRDKTNITKLLDMIDLGKIGVMGSRINFVEFDEKMEIQKKVQSKDKVAPLWVQCNYYCEELIVLTNKDLRVIDLRKGTVKNIYCQFHTEQISITYFKYFESLQKFVIGNQKGQIHIYCMKTGRGEGRLLDHTGSITHIDYDQQNKIFVTMSQDSAIQIQKHQSPVGSNFSTWCESGATDPDSSEKKGQASQWEDGASINRSKIVGSKSKFRRGKSKTKPNEIIPSFGHKFAFSEESSILLRQMKNNFNNREITLGCVSIYHSLIAVGSSSDSHIYIWDYQFSKLLIQISLPDCSHAEPTALSFINGYSVLVIGASDGNAYFIKITKIDHTYSVKTIGILRSSNPDPITHIATDLLIKGFSVSKEKFDHCRVYFGTAGGFVTSVDLSTHMAKVKQEPSAAHNDSFNAERQFRQNFITQIQKKKYLAYKINTNLDQHIFGEIKQIQKIPNRRVSQIDNPQGLTFQAHKGAITGLQIIQLDQFYLISIGTDEKIKIWRNNILLCDWNINLPLPFKWDLEVKNQQRKKEKIMFALKSIQEIFQRYGSEISINQSKCLKIKKLLDRVRENKKSDRNKQDFITQPGQLNKKSRVKSNKIILFQNEFTQKDLHYDNVKKFNFSQVAGPTLREIEIQKKLDLIQRDWAMSREKVEEDKSKLLMVIRNKAHKNQEKEQIFQFLMDKDNNDRDSYDPAGFPLVQNVMNQINSLANAPKLKKQVSLAENNQLKLPNKPNKENHPFSSPLCKLSPSQCQTKSSLRLYEKNKYRTALQNLKQCSEAGKPRMPSSTFEKYFSEKQQRQQREQQRSQQREQRTPSLQSLQQIEMRNKEKMEHNLKEKEKEKEKEKDKEKQKQKQKLDKLKNQEIDHQRVISFRSILFRMNNKVNQFKKKRIVNVKDEDVACLKEFKPVTSSSRRNMKFSV